MINYVRYSKFPENHRGLERVKLYVLPSSVDLEVQRGYINQDGVQINYFVCLYKDN